MRSAWVEYTTSSRAVHSPPIQLTELHEPVLNISGLVTVERGPYTIDDAGDGLDGGVSEGGGVGGHGGDSFDSGVLKEMKWIR